jgi:hypothetical protein
MVGEVVGNKGIDLTEIVKGVVKGNCGRDETEKESGERDKE